MEDFASVSEDAQAKRAIVASTLAEKSFGVLSLMQSHWMAYEGIEELVGCPEEKAFQRFYFRSMVPFVSRCAVGTSCGLRHWSPAKLKELVPDHEIFFQLDQPLTAEGLIGSEKFAHTCGFHEFLSDLEAGRASGRYITCRNALLSHPECSRLWDDIDGCLPLADCSLRNAKAACIWIGPEESLTPLHHDLTSLIIVQAYGTKHICLIPPFALEHVSNYLGAYSDLEVGTAEARGALRRKGIPVEEVVLEQGDALFIPAGWWHAVEGISVSISLTLHRLRAGGQRTNIRWSRQAWLETSR